MFMEERYKTG